MKIDPQKPYTARETAALLGVTEDTVKTYCRTGKMRGKRVGPKRAWQVLGDAIHKKRKEWGLDDNVI